MKPYDEMSYDEQQDYLDFAEAEYCPICGGKGEIPISEAATSWLCAPAGWIRCERCKGTGRA